ncbi:MAG TPA: hypothetical protein VKY45_06885 [Marinilabiliaceae bacterium]|nr:hypothetical protein [Marinilabiliaceae bacterium]
MKQIISIIPLIYLFVSGCNKTSERTIIIHSPLEISTENIIADTIIYSVIIRNFDKNDTWAEERLKYTQADKIISTIFDNAYEGKFQVFDYYTNTPLSIEQIKSLESSEEFSRDLIQELQFEEIWFMNDQVDWFHKEVLSINMGYAVYNSDGTQRGLKPVFRFRFDQNPTHPQIKK